MSYYLWRIVDSIDSLREKLMNVEQSTVNFICDTNDAYAVCSPDDKVISDGN